MSGGSVLPRRQNGMSGGPVNLVLPRPQKMHPSATGTREPTGCVISKATKEACPGGLAVTGLGKECTLPSIRSESERELLDLHFHRRPLPEFQDTVGTCRTKKQRQRQATPSRGESPKGMKDLQITKLRDDQERRPTPFQVAQQEGRELLASTKKTQWMRTAKKVKHRKHVPPMRKNRPQQKITKKTETASKTGANEKSIP